MRYRTSLPILQVAAIVLLCALLLGAVSACTSAPHSNTVDTDESATYDAAQVLAVLAPMATDAPTSEQVESVYLVNLENDLVLYQKNTDAARYPSSTVKITAGLIACRALEGRLHETVTLTAAMLSDVRGRQMQPPLQAGETLTVKDLLYAAICGGYNDAMTALACYTHGSVADFVEIMNAEAARVGAEHTHYTNPTGLHDAAMVTTAGDTVRIARVAAANDLYMTVSSAPSYDMAATNLADARSFSNRNSLVNNTNRSYYNGYCRGMNAGYTDEGGWCVVSVWERGGASNLCVLMGGEDAGSDGIVPAYRYANSLFDWAHDQFSYRTVIEAEQAFDEVKVGLTGTSKSKAELIAASELSFYLPRSLDVDRLSITHRLHGGSLTAPLSAGDEVGVAVVSVTGQNTSDTVLGTVPLTVKDSFEINPFLRGMGAFRQYLKSRAFIATVICFTVLLLAYLKWTSTPGGRYGVRTAKRKRRFTRRR